MNNKITDATILVTGGAGFVGSYVIEELLLHQPKKIRIIDNLIRGSYYNMQSYIDNSIIEFIEGDARGRIVVWDVRERLVPRRERVDGERHDAGVG